MLINSIQVKIDMIEAGIVTAFTSIELTSMLESLDPADRRKAKRKFRKLWRRFMKENPECTHLLVDSENKIPKKAIRRNRWALLINNFFEASLFD